MRTLVIGDIHGCLRALDLILAAAEPTAEDRLITLGDYVDRGPDSCGVLERLLQLHERYQVVSLTGNHEIMMRGAREDSELQRMWRVYGGEEALASYQQADDDTYPTLDLVPGRHWEFLDNVCRPYYETDSHIFVHAGVRPDVPLAQQDESTLFWDKFTDRGPHYSGKRVICGHTAQKSGWPANAGHSICIDTWVYGEGWLTCLDISSGHFWQASQTGRMRRGMLA